MREHRRAIRKTLRSNAIFISLKVASKTAMTLDLSTGGVSLTLSEPLQLGRSCAISFDVPSDCKKQRTLIRGHIVSCIRKSAHAYRIGIRFIHADPTSRALIDAAVDHHLTAAA